MTKAIVILLFLIVAEIGYCIYKLLDIKAEQHNLFLIVAEIGYCICKRLDIKAEPHDMIEQIIHSECTDDQYTDDSL